MRTSVVPGARTTGGAWSVALCSLAMAAGAYATLGFAPLAPLIREEFSLTRFDGDQARADAVYDNVPNPLSAEDIAETIVHAIELPAHVNLDLVTIKPVAQAAAHKLVRGPLTPRA